MYLYIQVTLFIRRTVRSIKKLLRGGEGASNQLLVLQSAKHLSPLHLTIFMFKCSPKNFVFWGNNHLKERSGEKRYGGTL